MASEREFDNDVGAVRSYLRHTLPEGDPILNAFDRLWIHTDEKLDKREREVLRRVVEWCNRRVAEVEGGRVDEFLSGRREVCKEAADHFQNQLDRLEESDDGE